MESRSVPAALLLLAATFLPPLLAFLPDGAVPACEEGLLLERVDPERLRGTLPVVGCGARGGGRFRPPRGAASLLLGRPIDLGTARAHDLQALPGIGPGLANRILSAREAGALQQVEDLERVPGLGRKRARAVAPWVRLGPERSPALPAR